MTFQQFEWDMFVAHLKPDQLESERFAMPSLDERPGSAADRRMRREHRERVTEYWYRQKFPTASPVEVVAMVIEAEQYEKKQTYKRDPVRFRALVDQVNNRKKAA